MKARIPKYRGLWEGECLVEGCPATCTVAGEWLPYPHTPRFFYCASDRQGELPDGWLYQHPQYIRHVSVDRGLFCPEHAPAWRTYRQAIIAWDTGQNALRKTWWLQFKSLFTKTTPPPSCPYEMQP